MATDAANSVEFGLVQQFDKDGLNPLTEPITQQSILKWADSLPTAPFGVIDASMGQGYEAEFLQKHGIRVLGLDPSHIMLTNAKFSRKVEAVAEHMPIPTAVASGVLLKDSLVYLSPKQREGFLQESMRVLVSGGSLLIISERLSDDKAFLYKRSDHNRIVCKRGDYTNLQQWRDAINQQVKAGVQLHSVMYHVTQPDLIQLAKQSGFKIADIKLQRAESAFADASRWSSGISRYVVRLNKPQS